MREDGLNLSQRRDEAKSHHAGRSMRFCAECAHFPAFAVIAGAADHGRIPLRLGVPGVISQEKIVHLFIEKPREFIDIYRIFQELLFAFCTFRVSPERRPDFCGQHPFRRLKNRRPTDGPLHHTPSTRKTPGGKCGGRLFVHRSHSRARHGRRAPGCASTDPLLTPLPPRESIAENITNQAGALAASRLSIRRER